MSGRLRIQFIAAYTIPAGTYFRVHHLARGLVQRGHEVEVRAVDPDPESSARRETRDGVPYEIMPESALARRFGAASHPVTALRRAFAASGSWDVVHLFQPFLAPALAWYATRTARVKAFDWDDLWWGGALSPRVAGLSDLWLGTWVRVLERKLPRRADLVTTCSGFLASRARDLGARAVEVVHNGYWPGLPPRRAESREQLGLDPGAIYAGFMGRTADELSWCTSALARVPEGHPPVRLAVCGPPRDALDALCADIRARVDHLGVLTPEQTRGFAAAIDLGLLPLADSPFNQSRFPIKFAEYLAAGIPVLQSAVGECAEVAHTWPWVTRAPAGPTAFASAFVDVVQRLRRGEGPRVDAVETARALAWPHLAARLEATYVRALTAR